MTRTIARALVVIAVVSGAACSDSARPPTSPTAPLPPAPITFDYAGTWSGTYQNVSCKPPGAICPGSYTANVNPITLTLRRVSNGFEGVLSGSNNISLGSVSEVPVSGQVRPTGELTLWGGVSYKTRCGSVSASFPPGGLSILSWTTVLDATGSRMAGEFLRSSTNNFSSCYTTTVLVDARIIVLTRMPASVPAAPVP